MKKSININAQPNSSQNNLTGGWRTFKPIIDKNKCIGCGRCSLVCPESTINMIKVKNKLKADVNYDYCKGCGLCAQECPVGAITMERDEK